MTYRVGAKEQVVVPKALRDRAGIGPGAEVEFSWVDGRIVLTPVLRPPGLAGRFAGSGMAARLVADRRAEPR